MTGIALTSDVEVASSVVRVLFEEAAEHLGHVFGHLSL